VPSWKEGYEPEECAYVPPSSESLLIPAVANINTIVMVIFRTKLIEPGLYGEGPSIATTKAQSESLGGQEEMIVSGTINGVRFEGTFVSNGDGTHYMNPDRDLISEAGLKPGDEFVVWAEVTAVPGPLEIPDDLREALVSDPAAGKAFEALPPRHKREHVEYIEAAKMSDTRMARIVKTVERLKEKDGDP
jgi:hypothetical protein